MRLGSAIFNGKPVLVALVDEDWLNPSVVSELFHDVVDELKTKAGTASAEKGAS
jgi:hypothetical protein